MRTHILIMPLDLASLSTLIGSNYPCLELIFMVAKAFEPLKFDCILREAIVPVLFLPSFNGDQFLKVRICSSRNTFFLLRVDPLFKEGFINQRRKHGVTRAVPLSKNGGKNADLYPYTLRNCDKIFCGGQIQLP